QCAPNYECLRTETFRSSLAMMRDESKRLCYWSKARTALTTFALFSINCILASRRALRPKSQMLPTECNSKTHRHSMTHCFNFSRVWKKRCNKTKKLQQLAVGNRMVGFL